jgi:hypothetical protein
MNEKNEKVIPTGVIVAGYALWFLTKLATTGVRTRPRSNGRRF